MKHVVIVGAGILGASVAYRLAGRDVSVTVIEAGEPASGTSGASFAWVNAQEKAPRPYFDLNVEGVERYPELAAELGGDWFHRGGDIVVGRGAGADKVRDRIARHEALGYPVRALDRAGVERLEPGLDLGDGDGDLIAAHFHDESWIDPPSLVRLMLDSATSRGATLRTRTPVASLEARGGRIAAIVLGSGSRLPVDEVLVAAGPATEGLAGGVGVSLPMSPSPGLLAVTEPIDGAIGHVVHAAGVALRPAGEGRLLVSSREVDATLDPELRELDPDAAPVAEVLERSVRLVPALRGRRIETVRIGRRSMPRDGYPAAGRAPGIDNLYLLASHSGVTLAPVLGRLVASELAGSDEAALAPYRLERFVARVGQAS